MPRPLRKEYCGARYHVTARGNGRNAIFLCNDDYVRFLDQLAVALDKDGVVLFAYVVLPNHYHLLVETPKGNLHAFIQRLNTAYSLYWRYKHKRPGHVFQGRYGAKLVIGDSYLLGLTRYIHLNPVKGKWWNGVAAVERCRYLEVYRWSSYFSYIKKNGGLSFVNVRWLELMGGKTLQVNRKLYRAYVTSMILQSDAQLQEALNASRYVVGDESCVKTIEQELNAKREGDKREADIVWPEERYVSLSLIDKIVSTTYEINQENLKAHGNVAGEAKKMALELACLYGGLSQRSVGAYYGGVTCAAVSSQRKTLHARMARDELLHRRFQQLVAKLKH